MKTVNDLKKDHQVHNANTGKTTEKKIKKAERNSVGGEVEEEKKKQEYRRGWTTTWGKEKERRKEESLRRRRNEALGRCLWRLHCLHYLFNVSQ